MDVTCKNVFGLLGLICLCFVGIPLRVKEQDSTEQEFLQFIENHNKSYAKEPTEYARRLEYFKVRLFIVCMNSVGRNAMNFYL